MCICSLKCHMQLTSLWRVYAQVCDLEKEFVGMSSIIEENLTILTKKDVLFATKPWKL